jgi:hypothetical protein
MFERGTSEGTQGPVAAEVTLADGRALRGRLLLPAGLSLPQLLNGPASFIEFEPAGGARIYIAKSSVCSLAPLNVPPAPSLRVGNPEGADFNPHAILGIRAGATREQAHEAYIALAKIYHPDRYVTVDLPAEVRDYLAAMARRINAAYEALETEQKKRNNKAEPVYTKAAQG